jgi:predicted TIM-barrel fold metal-dependent hydrolase
MWFDINACVGHWPFKQFKFNSCKTLLERMNEFGVERAVISNLNGIFYKNTQSANEELFDEIRSDRNFTERFVPFAVINPIYAGWKADLEECHKKMGMKGIRLYPLYHDYEINDPACIELAKMARDMDLPVAFTLRMVDARQRSWMDINREWELKDIIPIIREVPDGKYMILNIANSTRLSDEESDLLRKTNILMDTSGRAISSPGEMISKYGKEKFAFGTHSPVLDYLAGMLRIDTLKEDEADEAVKNLLRSGNAIKMLGV